MEKKVNIYTLGCKLNFTESSTIARQFKENGFQVVDFEEKADIYIINTCSVTENADKKCRKVIKQALKKNAQAFIVVIGCYAQLKPKEIAQIPGVDLVLGAAEKFNMLPILKELQKKPIAQVHSCNIKEVQEFIPSYSIEDRTRSFLKIQDGCDYKCSFCTIPLARGQSRSASVETILKNAQEIEKKGCQELVLTGINLGDYGKGIEPNFKLLDVLKLLNEKLQHIPRIRLSSIEPNLLDDEIIEFVASHSRFMPHFHMPLQSGSNRILRLMRRRYKKELYENRVMYIKKLIPHAAIGCDVIVGFPGESEADFLETFEFIRELPITYLHVFPFSERANTPAIHLPEKVPPAVKEERTALLRNLSLKKKFLFCQEFSGKVEKVLFENSVANNLIWGFTENYIKVGVPYNPELINCIEPVLLKTLLGEGVFVGELSKVPDCVLPAEF
ncbi:MAG: tRNA (N(6)-L-threonylcarbamoyladenosine(37)-C(2))-methylthiotransferase MtaB [Bacteroidia bacterium]|nr:tRNA (N(6)-L-threonylcarbamoyladenosine(37)-C(2))-methylthiotransferase MtaB [Bacteroidia bacterium]MDW8157690.1 tRNA (N(6)-L-threonylcarbamoyladenosine(37)-C(2))-methylthiotransferase MtaB [Bacteroidia bacterium]